MVLRKISQMLGFEMSKNAYEEYKILSDELNDLK